MSEHKPFVPFIPPQSDMPEFTIRVLIIGLVLRVVLGWNY